RICKQPIRWYIESPRMYDLTVEIKEMKYIFYNIGGISTRNGLVITFVVKEVIILVWLDLKLPEVLVPI
ncbi:MAG: hypothetical protein WAM42_18560, partial [Candidatus Nitrosopolaris sp.]